MSEVSNIQWFPGHMAKTRRLIMSNLKLVDAVVELRDARIPYSSANPEMDYLAGGKPRLILLNKCDAADGNATSAWIDYYKKQGKFAAAVDCRSGRNLNRILPILNEMLRDRISDWNKKGMVGRPVRIMVVGIPNVGKSSFINKMAGTKRAKVEDRPGVTRGKQWVAAGKGLELLDMPGVLWPKFQDKLVGERLAFTGAVKDDVTDMEYLACRFLELVVDDYPQQLTDRYGISIDGLPESNETSGCEKGYELLCRVATKRGFLVSGGEVNTERAAITVLDEFRSGKLGRLTLELPAREQ